MNDKTKRTLAIIALGFMAVFTVSFIVFLVKPDLWNGAIAFITLFSGVGGIGIFAVIKLTVKTEIQNPDEDSSDNEDSLVSEEGLSGDAEETAVKEDVPASDNADSLN